jgi:hypothetical protein
VRSTSRAVPAIEFMPLELGDYQVRSSHRNYDPILTKSAKILYLSFFKHEPNIAHFGRGE